MTEDRQIDYSSREHWDGLYRAQTAPLPWETSGLPEDVQQWIPRLPHHSRILDLGCGRGGCAMGLARLGFRVTGIDFSDAAIAAASRSAQLAGCSRVDFRVADILSYRAADAFNLVYDYSVLHHIAERDTMQYKRAVAGLTRPGAFYGLVCYSELNGAPVATRVGTLGNLIHHRSHAVIRRLFDSAFDCVDYARTILGPQGKHPAHMFLFRRIDDALRERT